MIADVRYRGRARNEERTRRRWPALVALGNGAAAGPLDTALHYAALNTVGTIRNDLGDRRRHPRHVDVGGGFVATSSDWTTGNPYAVKTTTRYTLRYIFARFFGFTTKN